ncbi:MAG: hypothetical protein ACR2G7_13655 [Acidimicrobiales bacterium]
MHGQVRVRHPAAEVMALANLLTEAGHQPERVRTTAEVHLDEVGGAQAPPAR